MASTPDRLNGWKEIATFVGKGVRTTQRWERTHGLPVRRLGPGSDVVYASRREIEAWLQALHEASAPAPAPARLEGPPPVLQVQAAPQAPPVPARPALASRLLPALAVVALPLVLAVVAVVGAPAMPSPFAARPLPSPAATRVDGRVLEALDTSGTRLWMHAFGFDLKLAPEQSHPGSQTVMLEDLDDDGRREVLVSMWTGREQPDKALYVLNADGSLRFRFEPTTPTVTFGADPYPGPWLNYKLFVVRDAARKASIFAVFIHGTDFPSVVVQLAPDGRVLGEYWSNGYVDFVTMGTWQGRPSIVIGATSNDTSGASLAVFDADRFGGSAPAEQFKYRCTSCAPGGPREMLIFPRRCLSDAVGGQATIYDVWRDGLDRLNVLVAETPIQWSWANAWYVVSAAPRIESASYATGYVERHRELTQRGAVDHRYEDVDEAALLPVQRWQDGRFVVVPSYAEPTQAPARPPVTRQSRPGDAISRHVAIRRHLTPRAKPGRG
jgi:hypothetical protein